MERLFVFCVCFVGSFVIINAALEPTKIVDQGVYSLENQNDGNFLTASGETSYGKTRLRSYSEIPSRSQKWLFTLADNANQLWAVEPITGENTVLGDSLWKITYVGHGKYQFQSSTTNLCVHAPGGGRAIIEKDCQKSNPNQRWFLHPTTAPEDV